VDGDGNILEKIKVKNREEELGEFLRKHVNRSKIAIEATGNRKPVLFL